MTAATNLFTDIGYDESPMKAIAAAAGVTTNTIYWYFKDKDALLVAVLDGVLAQTLADAAERTSEPWENQLLWAVERLEHYGRLVTVVHARTASSPVIDAWHTRFHELAEAMLADGFRGAGVSEDALHTATQIGVFVIEGLLLHRETAPRRRDIVHLLAHPRALVGDTPHDDTQARAKP